MTLFWILAIALLAISLLFVFVPLWRARTVVDTTGARRGATGTGLSIYRSQMAELDADHQAGALSEAQYQAAKVDLQRSLLEMSESAKGSNRTPSHSWRWAAGGAALMLVPVLAVGIYQGFGGGPLAFDPPRQPDPSETVASAGNGPDEIVEALRERLDQSPDDPIAWALLGKVYHAMGLTRQAAQAYAESLEYGGNHDADILVDYADVLGTIQNGNLEGRPRELVRRALAIEPDHVTGLWLAGTAAFRAGDYADAREHWQRLARRLPEDSQNGAVIRANLDELEARLARAGDVNP
ncbi:Cytochrome c heme lyase subunit CcmH [Thioalkalivibrio nitratireducens DSM 14787]|uniref:Cytochrome c heme lyase subunit CcmH n=1 Tax=Thioalkalivibrio nitratireducens (strain DSM 14787 / UNIQEM 213 / ALEN2) TaxID=1255043 RepID=L0DUG2_THIND|nr:c-type cytochrome biogenesis protein CcmI [Thioalkalivibrio nitratireducens]AGA31981.1 Cytochrome c heme lyase subunit CcmH [Thioalkalivibrio nitratireducens DSM 14787]